MYLIEDSSASHMLKQVARGKVTSNVISPASASWLMATGGGAAESSENSNPFSLLAT
jgi:hypothetical protein